MKCSRDARRFPTRKRYPTRWLAVLKGEPVWSALPGRDAAKIRTLLERCLRKDVRRRLPDIGEARIEIEEARSEPILPAAADRPTLFRVAAYLWPAVAVLSLLAAAASAGWILLAPVPTTGVVRFDIVAPQGAAPLPPMGARSTSGSRFPLTDASVAFLASPPASR